MNQFSKIDWSHHAYCLEGDSTLIKEELFKILERNLKFQIKANPDFWLGKFDVFGINDGRKINDFQNKKAITGGRKIIVVETNSMTREAQNSLLKTFEEPTPDTHFFLILPSAEILLPTLKSRVVIVPMSDMGNSHMSDMGEKFLKASKKERLDMAKEMAENKDKSGAIKLLNQLEQLIYNASRPLSSQATKWATESEVLKTINKFRGYLNDRAPNIKMILEHLALITPR